MWKKNEGFSQENIAKLLSSKEAMALAAMLRQMDQNTLSQAASAATQGNTAKAQELLAPLLADPELQKMLKNMEGNNG